MNRPGRPKLDDGEDSTTVNVTLVGREYDRLAARAAQEGCSVQEIMRRVLRVAKDGGKRISE